MCCTVLKSQSVISSRLGGGTDLRFEQNRGSGARGSVLLFAGGGEITCSHLGTLLE